MAIVHKRLSRVATMNKLYKMQREIKEVKLRNDFRKAKNFGAEVRYVIKNTDDSYIARIMIFYYPPKGFVSPVFKDIAENYLNRIISMSEYRHKMNK